RMVTRHLSRSPWTSQHSGLRNVTWPCTFANAILLKGRFGVDDVSAFDGLDCAELGSVLASNIACCHPGPRARGGQRPPLGGRVARSRRVSRNSYRTAQFAAPPTLAPILKSLRLLSGMRPLNDA